MTKEFSKASAWGFCIPLLIFVLGFGAITFYQAPDRFALYGLAVIPVLVICLLLWRMNPRFAAMIRAMSSFPNGEQQGLPFSILMFIVVVLIASVPVTFWAQYVNGKYATGPETCRDSRILGTFHCYKCYGGSTLNLTSWRKGEDKVAVDVGPAIYGSVRDGDELTVCTRPGALGVEWISRIFPVSRPDTNAAHETMPKWEHE